MAFVPANDAIVTKNGIVYQNNQYLFSIKDIFTLPNLEFQFIHQTGLSLQFSVTKDNTVLGILALRWKSRAPNLDGVQSDSFETQLLTSTLTTKLNWSQTSSHDIPSMIAYTRGETLDYLG